MLKSAYTFLLNMDETYDLSSSNLEAFDDDYRMFCTPPPLSARSNGKIKFQCTGEDQDGSMFSVKISFTAVRHVSGIAHHKLFLYIGGRFFIQSDVQEDCHNTGVRRCIYQDVYMEQTTLDLFKLAYERGIW